MLATPRTAINAVQTSWRGSGEVTDLLDIIGFSTSTDAFLVPAREAEALSHASCARPEAESARSCSFSSFAASAYPPFAPSTKCT